MKQTQHCIPFDTGCLHSLFITLKRMTPDAYKNGGESLSIRYSEAESLFGKLLIASTDRGICYLAFADKEAGLAELKVLFPKASYQELADELQEQTLTFFRQDWHKPTPIPVHVKGTDFQLKVWEALLSIPIGTLTTYGEIARQIEAPKACRAVGSAVGDNPVSFFIPCHRVVRSTGAIGQYHWGSDRKAAMIEWEKSIGSKPLANAFNQL